MKFVRILLINLPLFIYGIYFLLNTRDIEKGSGELLIVIIVLLTCINMLINRVNFFRHITLSSLGAIFFIIIHCCAWLLSELDVHEFVAHTIGTGQGLVFAILLGTSFGVNLRCLIKFAMQNPSFEILIKTMGIMQIFSAIAYTLTAILTLMQDVRDDLFYIQTTDALYQRPAAIITMYFLAIISFVVVILISGEKYNRWVKFFLGGATFLLVVMLAILSQLLGSNSGLLCVVSSYLLFLTWWHACQTSTAIAWLNTKIKCEKSSLLFWTAKRFAISLFKISILFVGFIVISFIALDFDTSKIRLFGFGNGKIDSLTSRADIFMNNYLTHLSYAPLTGAVDVELKTTGKGSYIHSLLSISTHLGILSFIFFSGLILLMFRDIFRKSLYFKTFGEPVRGFCFVVFRAAMVLNVMMIATISTFYTWMPFWFCLGLFGITLLHEPNSNRRDF